MFGCSGGGTLIALQNNSSNTQMLSTTEVYASSPSGNYLTFTANTAGSSVTFNYSSGSDVQYTTDGTTWTNCEAAQSSSPTTITLTNVDDWVQFKGTNVTTDYSYHFSMTGSIAGSGDVTSLTNAGLGGDVNLATANSSSYSNCYKDMFYGCSVLTTAPNLPSTTLASSCYYSMFSDCSNLITAPELPATTLASDCYFCMFYGCTSLTSAPSLPATTLKNYCYSYMFQDCTSLITAPKLPATTLANSCYFSMFYGCTSLTSAPSTLPAPTLAEGCYKWMFKGCTSLTRAPVLSATTLADNCYLHMFYRCTSLEINTNSSEKLDRTLIISDTSEYSTCCSLMFNGTKGNRPSTTPSSNTIYYNPVKGYYELDDVVDFVEDDGYTVASDFENWMEDLQEDADIWNEIKNSEIYIP